MKTLRDISVLTLLLAASLTAVANTWQWATRAGGDGDDAVLQILPDGQGGSYSLTAITRRATFGTNLLEVPAGGRIVSRVHSSGAFLWSQPVPASGSDISSNFQITPAPDGGIRVIRSWIDGGGHWTLSRFTAAGELTGTRTNAPTDIGTLAAAAAQPDGGVRLLFQGGETRQLDAQDQLVSTSALNPAPAFPIARMRIDSQGAISLLGRSAGRGIHLFRYAPDGTLAWSQFVGGGNPQFNAAPGDLILDLAGNPVVTGNGEDTDGPFTHFVSKFDRADGHRIWSAKLGPVPGNFGYALGIDAQGRIYNSGTYYGEAQLGAFKLPANGYSEAFLTRLSPDGQIDWVETWGGSLPYLSLPELQDIPICMTVSAAGDVTLGGTFRRTTAVGPFQITAEGDTDAFIVRFGTTPLARVSPGKRDALIGEPVTFTADATGTGPLSYQWLHEGQPIPNATSRDYTLANVTPADAGDYSVTVANSVASVTSQPATLTVRSEGIAIQFYAGIRVVGEVGRTYEILSKDRLDAADWTIAATLTLTAPSQTWFDLTSPGIPSRIYSFRQK